MESDPSLLSLNVAMGVLLVDILLSGDNAIVIALACRSLSKEHRVKALWLGVLGAFLARLVLASSATLALRLPLIKLIGGLILLKISIELLVNNAKNERLPEGPQRSSASDLFAAAKTIVLADIVMSLDNVLALSVITQNSFQMLFVGLLISIPILMFGSLYISRVLDVFPYVIWAGGAILGAVGGALMIDDPIFGGAFSNASSIGNLVVPAIAAAFVVMQSRIVVSNEASMHGRPKPKPMFAILFSRPALPVLSRAPMVPVTHALVTSEPVSQTAQGLAVEDFGSPARVSVLNEAPALTKNRFFRNGYLAMVVAGLLLILAAWGIGYLVNSPLLPLPEGFITYRCKEPAMSISYLPGAKKIRFTSPTGVVGTTVIKDRIVWDDYRTAGKALNIPPPIKIVSADTFKLIVTGGMFENASCFSSTPK
jgi:YjbE family integral membrane protein